MDKAFTISARIASIYVVVGAAWILFSDELLAYLVHDPLYIMKLSIYKGWLYVAATGLMLYLLINRTMRLLLESKAALKEQNRILADAEDELKRQITEQQRAEQELQTANGRLKESEERYRELFENNPHPMWVYDLETLKFLMANDAAIEKYGFTKGEFLSMTIKDIRPAEDIPLLLEEVAAVSEGYRNAGIWRHRKKDGAGIMVEIVSHTISFGGRPAEVVLANDVTERLEAEEAQRAGEKLLRTVLETLPVGVWIVSDSGRVVQGNRAGREIWGGERLLGMDRYGEFKGWWAHNGKRIEPHEWSAARAIRNGETSINEIIDIEAFDGKRKAILSSTVPLRDDAGKIVGALVVNQDITEQRKVEEEIRKLNVELERRVQLRTAQLEAANKELESFSYSVSHDLRAPLRHIEGFSRVLLEDYGNRLDEEGRVHLQRLVKAGSRMSQLVEDLLKLSRAGRGDLERTSVNLSRMARALALELKLAEPQRNVEMKIADDVVTEADARLVRVVLENLLGNSWKYTSKKEHAVIEFGTCTDKGLTAYYVRDDGAGFDMRYADKLFEPFQRLHRYDEFEGTGIGLATVKRIVARHGGRIWAEGAPGAGATFYFTLSGVDE